MAHKRRRTSLPPYSENDIEGIWQHDLFEVTEKRFEAENWQRQRENRRPAELYISNLHYDVSEQDLFDLFSSVGQLKDVSIHFDRSGRSTGSAKVFFKRKVDALEAISKYNGCHLGQQKFKIELWECSTTTVPFRQRRNTPNYGNGVRVRK